MPCRWAPRGRLVRACRGQLAAQGANLCVGMGEASRGANAVKHSLERKDKRLTSRSIISPLHEHSSLPKRHQLPALKGPALGFVSGFCLTKVTGGQKARSLVSFPSPFKNFMKCP